MGQAVTLTGQAHKLKAATIRIFFTFAKGMIILFPKSNHPEKPGGTLLVGYENILFCDYEKYPPVMASCQS